MITLTPQSRAQSTPRRRRPPRPPSEGLYHALLARLAYRDNGSVRRARSVGVTSCSPGEGATTVAGNLALQAAASSEGPVVLVDANLARPTLHRKSRLNRSPGLADALLGTAEPSQCVQAAAAENLSIVTAGTSDAARGAYYPQDRLSEFLEALQQDHSLVVVDLPAATDPTADYRLAGALDVVFLVAEAERTRTQVAARVSRKLAEAGVPLRGLVLNKQTHHGPRWLCRPRP